MNLEDATFRVFIFSIVAARIKYKSNIIMYLIKRSNQILKPIRNINKLIKSTASKTKYCNLKDRKDNCFSREIRNGGISFGKFAEKYWRKNAWCDKCFAHFEIIVSSSRTRTRSSRQTLLTLFTIRKKPECMVFNASCSKDAHNNRELVA